MSKITEEVVKESYKVAKKVYTKEITLKEGKNILSHYMKPNSANDYIYNFKCMMDGKKFTRTNNAYAVEYYLENIYNEYGFEILKNALKSVKLHIEYYEPLKNIIRHKERKIHEKFSQLLNENLDNWEQDQLVKKIEREKKTKQQILSALNKVKNSNEEYITYNGMKAKRDNYAIALIKSLRDNKCQICGKSILKKDKSLYIEAAHITPKHRGGKETLDNIILLCPNHHKEFDLGDMAIIKYDGKHIKFLLNERQFEIFFEEEKAL